MRSLSFWGTGGREGGDSARACSRHPHPPTTPAPHIAFGPGTAPGPGFHCTLRIAPPGPTSKGSIHPGGGAAWVPPACPPRSRLLPRRARFEGGEPRPSRAMSTDPELIELRELTPTRRPGPGRTRLERANALRIAPGPTRDPARQLTPGRGHRFQPAGPATHTWCDLCGDFIWGVVRKGLQCACE